jgi:hypothetical protein
MAFSFFALIVHLTIGACLIGTADANAFLKANPSAHQERISENEIQSTLLAEVEGTFGSGSATSRLKQMEADLMPMFAALPKNEYGNLGRATVRYALHRFFVQRHGWFIKGLHESGSHRNSTSTAGLLKEQVPGYLQDLFEKQLGGQGFGLHELAVLAATIEHLVHKEAVKRLGEVLSVHKLLPTSLMLEKTVDKVLDTYMTGYILGEDFTNKTEEEVMLTKMDMPYLFMAWPATKEFVRSVRKNITQSEGSAEQKTSGAIDFALVARVAERVGEQFGRFQDHECRQMKDALVAKEVGGTGRLRLSDFWKPALNNPDGAWQFQESLSYLRQVGALDESDAQNPRVMIANYISSPTNCIASSSFYSVCCMDECEGLIGHLEKSIAAPEAHPERIAALITDLPSSSVAAPQTLSPTLLSRLDEIAAGHGGTVQLHGRLFAQWMHHVYPRECPFPHVAGTTNPQTPDEWLEATGEESVATVEEIHAHINQFNETDELESDSLPWSSEEELLVHRVPIQNTRSSSIMSSIRGPLLFAAMAALIYSVVRSTSIFPNAKGAMSYEKQLV